MHGMNNVTFKSGYSSLLWS